MNKVDIYQIVTEYQEKGFVHIKSLFNSDEIKLMKSECKKLLQDEAKLIDPFNIRTWHRNHAFGIKKLEKFDPIIDISQVFFNIAYSTKLLKIVTSILQGEPQLLKDKLIFKMTGDMGYALHQDFAWWTLVKNPSNVCSVFIAVESTTKLNGAIEITPRKKKVLYSTLGEKRNLTKQEIEVNELEADIETIEMLEGDILIFHSLAPHRSAPNISNKSRFAFYPTFVANENIKYSQQQQFSINEIKKQYGHEYYFR
jgi:2-aminoethylphosphonate dioxygenase